MADTLVDSVIAALVPLFRTAVATLDIPATAVHDGGYGTEVQPEYVCVGWTDENVPDVVGITTGVGNDATSESFDIRCEFGTVNGDADMAAAMARAGEIRSTLGAALKLDRTLGGLIYAGRAEMLGPYTYRRDQTDGGAEVTGVFNVHVSIGWIA